MKDPDEVALKWKVDLWQHESGKSRAEKELSKFARQNPTVFVNIAEKMVEYQKQEISVLEKTQYIKKIKNGNGLYEIRFLFNSGNVRLIGPINKDALPLPTFYALLFFHKKGNDIPQNILANAVSRLKEFNNTLGAQYGL